MNDTRSDADVGREDMAALLAALELESITTVSVHGERRVQGLPDEVAIRIQQQRPTVDQVVDAKENRVLIRYAHRATFFPGAEPPVNGENEPEVDDEQALGLVEVAHVAAWRSSASEPHDEATLQALAEADAYFVVYPYVRQALQHVAEQVQLPPLVLPVLNRDIARTD